MPRVAVVGPGAVGTVFAAALQSTERHEIILCSRPAAVHPMIVEREDGYLEELQAVTMTSPESLAGPGDWVILAVKAHQVPTTEAWLRALCSPKTTVVVLQNGIEHRLLTAPLVGDATVLPAIVWTPAERVGLNTVRSPRGVRASVPNEPAGYEFADLMAGGNAEIAVTEDFMSQAWQKLCINAVAGLMAVVGCRAGVFRHRATRDLAFRLAEECAHVGRAVGASLPSNLPEQIVDDLVGMPAEMGTSILFDRLAGRPLEWEARNEVIQRLGRTHGIATPVSDVIVPLLDALSGYGCVQ